MLGSLLLTQHANAQAVFSNMSASGGAISGGATTANVSLSGQVKVGQSGDAIRFVYLYEVGGAGALAYKSYTVTGENPPDTLRSFVLAGQLGQGEHYLYVTAYPANGTPTNSGTYLVTVTGGAKQNQTINFAAISNQTYGTSGPTLAPTATSKLAVSLSSQTSTCGLSGNTVTFNSAGPCTIAADQSGDTSYNAAPRVTQGFTIGKGSQSISFSPGNSGAIGSATLSASSSSGLLISFAASPSSVCTVSGSTITYSSQGTCQITATQNGDGNYNAALPVVANVSVGGKAQSISFSLVSIGAKTYGDGGFGISANATSGLDVSFSASGACSVSGSTVSIISAGTCSITASQTGGGSWAAASPVVQAFTVGKRAQSISMDVIAAAYMGTYPTASANASSGLPVTFNSSTYSVCGVSGTSIVLLSPGTCTITAVQKGDDNYSAAAQQQVSFPVYQNSQSISFPAIPNQSRGMPAPSLSANATSGLSVTYSAGPFAVCSVSGATVSINGTGTCTITASQSGNAGYAAAAAVSQSFDVQINGAYIDPQASISVSVPSTMVAGQIYAVSVKVKNTGTSTWTSSGAYPYRLGYQDPLSDYNWGINRVNVPSAVAPQASVTFSFNVTAPSKPGNYNFQWQMLQELVEWFGPPSPKADIHVVAPNFITFNALADRKLGDVVPALSASATSELPIQFSSKTGDVCTVSGATLTLLKSGYCTVAANQGASANYQAAVEVTQKFLVTTDGNNAIFLDQTIPSSMRTGQPYMVTVRMLNTGSTTWTAGIYKLGSQNLQDNRIWGTNSRAALSSSVAPKAVGVFTFMVTAPADPSSYNFQWRMVQEYVEWFGVPTDNVSVPVTNGTGPTVSLAASAANVRLSTGTTAKVTFTGKGLVVGRTLTKLELFQDSGNGFSNTPINTMPGTTSTLNFNYNLDLPAGLYRFKLRATDSAAVPTDSSVVYVNVTNSVLLGEITGVEQNESQAPQLVGWVCMPGDTSGLTYTVYANGPLYMGGIKLVEGVANVSNRPGDSEVRSKCGTTSNSHNFVVDLSTYTSQYAGSPLYVEAKDTNGHTIVLPCADNSCTMPGSLRIGLTSPTTGTPAPENTAIWTRALLSNNSGSIDEVAFSMNGGTWQAAAADGMNAYSLSMPGLPARQAAYTAQARVRQGNMTLYSALTSFNVLPASTVTVIVTSSLNGSNANIGSPVALTAALTGDTSKVTQVVFTIGGKQITATGGGTTWTASWTPDTAGTTTATALAKDTNNLTLGSATAINITVNAAGTSSSAPIAVQIAPPAFGDMAGTLPGQFGVSNGGAATYGIPIEVPPGTAGVAPAFTLNYSSQGTNGMVGLGWTLGGNSSIHRCGKTIAQDSVNARISFSTNDRLCLDGQRLVLVNGTNDDTGYWSDTAEYRTEIDSFSRITAKVGGLGRYFVVESKDGRITTYGSTTSSYEVPVLKPINCSPTGTCQPAAKSGALSWKMDETKDRFGNFIRYAYVQDAATGEHKLSAVRYGGKGKSAHAAVYFEYESRPDVWTRYVDQARNDQRTRLAHITTYVGTNLDGALPSGTRIRKYDLSYEVSPTSGRSLLKTVAVAARNPQTGIDDVLPPTTFDWGKPAKAAGFAAPVAWASGPVLSVANPKADGSVRVTMHPELFVMSDFENHGRIDILQKSTYPLGLTGTALTDDFPSSATTLRSSYDYYHNNGSGFTKLTYQLNTNEDFGVLDIGDFNGDGAPDILVSDAAGALKVCVSPMGDPNYIPASPIVFTCGSGSTGSPAQMSLNSRTLQRTSSVTSTDPGNCGDPVTQGKSASPAPISDCTSSPAIINYSVTGSPASPPLVTDIIGDGRAALYGRIGMDGTALLCIQDRLCTSINNPPLDALGYDYANDGSREYNRHTYAEFTESVDYGGVGKPYDTRLSRPHFVSKIQVDNDFIGYYKWVNLTPQITISIASAPGYLADAAPIASYTYAPYVPLGPWGPPSIQVDLRTPYSFEGGAAGLTGAGDFNGAGYSGIVFGFREHAWNSTLMTFGKAEMTLCASTGRELDCHVRKKYSTYNSIPSTLSGTYGGSEQRMQYLAPIGTGNFIGDGQTSILARSMTQGANAPVTTGNLYMCRVMGDDNSSSATGLDDTNMVCDPWTGATLVGTLSGKDNNVFFYDLLGTGRTQIFQYSETRTGQNIAPTTAGWTVTAPIDIAADGQALDRIYAATNGVGSRSTVEYGDGLTTGLVSRSGLTTLTYPRRLSSGIGKYVRRLVSDNGVAGTLSQSYRYQDAGIDATGRGSMGFARFMTTDEQTGFVTTNVYEQQTWQLNGMLRSTEVRKPGCGSPLMSQTNRTQAKTISQSNGSTTWFPYVASSTATTADLTCTALTTAVTSGPSGAADISYDNWGNLLGNDVVTSGDGQTYTTTTVNSYKTADVQNWLVGLLDLATVSKVQSSDAKAISRSVKHDYEAVTGALKTQTLQPDDATNRMNLVTTFGRSKNPFGLVDTKTVSWVDPFSSGKQEATEVTIYDDNGRFATSITNAMAHTQTLTYFEGTGTPKSVTDPNGLTVNRETDGFGRVTSEQQLANGNTTQTTRKQCGGAALCAPGTAMVSVIERFNGGVRTSVPQMTFADSVGHPLRSVTYSTDGTRGAMPVIVDQHYDARGRLLQQDQPRFDGDPAILAKYMEYDDLNRVTLTRVLDDAGANSDTKSEYAQWVTTQTNALNYKRVETRDALGRLTQVLDAKNGTTSFKYDAFGNLTNTTDPSGNIIVVRYDSLGRKIALNDPDLGNISYLVDARGLVRRQVSPNHAALPGYQATPPASPTADKAMRMEYDLLGRMTARYEPDLESHWLFDQQPGGNACQITMSCGQLVEAYTGAATNKDYRRTHAYDPKGRPSTVWQHLFDADYTSTPIYDDWSRPSSVTYQRGSDAKKTFDQRYDALGALVRIERQGAKLWEASAWDAAGHVLTAKLGNGLTQSQSYYNTTNRFKNSTLATATGIPRLTEGYSYDKLGNVYTRTWAWNTTPVTETFSYDALNRIEWSEVSGQARQNFSYDATGNITFKTGVGTYTYQTGAGVARPHAVQSILNAASVKTSFTYDSNGNRTGSDNRTESWTSFDMPVTLTKTIAGTTYSNQFLYGAEHQRTRQIKKINGTDAGMVIYAGAQEVETTNGVTSVKTYWPMGLGVEIDKNGVTNQYWSHKDNLGSPIGLTNGVGDFTEQLAYDVWGKRRTLNGVPNTSGTPTPDSTDGVIDNKGYTGHEMLDQIDLVHMNGRVFDPLVGKFLSADPLIQDPVNGQNYNRYAYVLNNPTNLTDPTGFEFHRGDTLRSDAQLAANKMDRADDECSKRGCTMTAKDANGNTLGEKTFTAKEYKSAASGETKVDPKKPSANSGGGTLTPGQRSFLENSVACAAACAAVEGAILNNAAGAAGGVGAVPGAGGANDPLRLGNPPSLLESFSKLFRGDSTAASGPLIAADNDRGAWNYRERALSAAGIDAGSELAKNYEVHHVVEQGRLGAEQARRNLNAVGIGVHDIENLVVLPRPHQGVHTVSYTNNVNILTTAARPAGYAGMVGALSAIKSSLIVKGTFP